MDPNSVEHGFGAYRTNLGAPLTRAANGDLFLNGSPTGLKGDLVGNVGRGPYRAPEVSQPTGAPSAAGAWTDSRVSPGPAGPSHGPSLLATPIYLWMAALALLVDIVVSGSPMVIREGLHLHPVYGVTAAFAVIGFYRYLMTWFPTAVVVTLASTSTWAVLAWAWRHGDALRDLPTERSQAFAYLTALATRFQQSMLATPDRWVVAIAAGGLVLHLIYWRHRRAVAAEHGWLLNRGLANAARTLGTLAATSGAIGLVFGFIARWSR